VRLIDEEGKDVGVMPLFEALKYAQDRNLDVIEVQPHAIPPVAKLMNYSKYIYRLSKSSRKHQKTKAGLLKGIRFGFKTSGNDLGIKAKKTRMFLLKILIFFKLSLLCMRSKSISEKKFGLLFPIIMMNCFFLKL